MISIVTCVSPAEFRMHVWIVLSPLRIVDGFRCRYLGVDLSPSHTVSAGAQMVLRWCSVGGSVTIGESALWL